MTAPTTAVCTEDGCPTVVPDQPGNLCGGSLDGGPQGCGQPFCDSHLWATRLHGYLCGGDWDNLGDSDN